MLINFYTFMWAVLAVFSIMGLYLFNQQQNIISFLTDRKYLFFFLVASLIGMRQFHMVALSLIIFNILLMHRDYSPYLEQHQKHAQEVRH